MVLSYRHAFHAGGPSDVFKHVGLLALLRSRLAQGQLGRLPAAAADGKRKKNDGRRLAMIETHSGAGLYSLDRGLSLKLREHDTGKNHPFLSLFALN